jgi:dihydrodipicolinate synthase/N-acetylneuraminate lyase
VSRAKHIERPGVDAITVLRPFYFYATQQHLIRYFSDVGAPVTGPIYLYNNPVLTKNNIHPEMIAELRSRIPHGVKAGNQDCADLQTLIELIRGDSEFPSLPAASF